MTALLWVAVAGLAGSGAFLALVLVAAARFKKLKSVDCAPARPGVSLLKPLCGDEPRLRENLESFFRQDYPNFEIIFGTRTSHDPALRIVEELRRKYPEVPVSIVFAGQPTRPNAKIFALEKMIERAEFELLVISDSDVEVGPNYIQAVIPPLLDPCVGLVTCVYRGMPSGGFWSRLEAMAMSTEMTSGVLVAELLEGIKFALGPTMATRRDVLERIGGIDRLADYHSDDYVFGQWVAEAGMKVVLSNHVITHVAMNRSLRDSVLHQLRWMKTTYFARPLGYVASGTTYAMPFAVLGLVAGLLAGHPWLGIGLLAIGIANRIAQALIVGWGVTGDRESLRGCWFYPLRDLQAFCLWVWSLISGRTIVWRGQRYTLLRGGAIIPEEAAEVATTAAPEPQPVELSQ